MEQQVDTELNKNKLTSWTNEPTFDDLYKDYKSAQDDHSIYLAKLEEYKINYEGGVFPHNIPKGKSTLRPKLIRKQAEWEKPQLEEPFLNSKDMFNVDPRTFEDVAGAQQNETLINYQWEVKIDKTEIVTDSVKTLVDEGTVVVKTGWETDEDMELVDKLVPVYATAEESMRIIEQGVATGKMSQEQAQQIILSGQPIQVGEETIQVEEELLVLNQPTYEVCDNRNVILDPTARNTSELQFIIHEYDTDMSSLKQEEHKTETVVDEETGEETEESYGYYHNLKKIKVRSDDYETENEYLSDVDDDTSSFKFQDEARKKLRAYEYWGYWDINGDGEVECIVATWIDKTIIRMEKSPFPFIGLPFSIATYMPIKNEIVGEPPGALLVENQESIGKMTRAAHDITSDQAVGQEFIDEEFFASPSQRDNYNSGKTTYFRHGLDPKTSIFKQSIDAVPPTVFQMIDYQIKDAESLSGTVVFGKGINSQAYGSVATGIRSALDATAKRKLSILRRLGEDLFVDLASKTISMNQAFMPEQEVIRITNKEYVTIKRADISGEYDVRVEISTPEKDNDKLEKLNMLMQTNAASMDPGLAKIIYARMAELSDDPELEHRIESFEPEPDPAAEEMKKLQLENAQLTNQKLKAEIANIGKDIESEDSKIIERQSRTAQNLDSESKENMANARYKNAQAQNLESVSDLNKQKFVKIQDGSTRQEKIDDKELDHIAKQEQASIGRDFEIEKMNRNAEKTFEAEDAKRIHDFDMKEVDQLNNLEGVLNDTTGNA